MRDTHTDLVTAPERLRVVMATRSAGKVRELRALLADAGCTPVSLDEAGVAPHPDEEAIEVFDTFEANARAKAAYYAARCGGMPVLAEDSGLCVDALHGAPGVYSKRWSDMPHTPPVPGGHAMRNRPLQGHDMLHAVSAPSLDARNTAYLLQRMLFVPATARGAAYVCVAVLQRGDRVRVARGETRGRILDAPCGTGGFGYDPVFWSTELDKCFGAVAAEEKARVSHRARAVRALLAEGAAARRPR